MGALKLLKHSSLLEQTFGSRMLKAQRQCSTRRAAGIRKAARLNKSAAVAALDEKLAPQGPLRMESEPRATDTPQMVSPPSVQEDGPLNQMVKEPPVQTVSFCSDCLA